MVKPPFAALSMPPAGSPERDLPRRQAAGRRAIGVATITGRADREERVAAPADLLAKGRVHQVGAAAPSDWTRSANRGTNRADWLGRVGASRRSPRVWSSRSRPSPSLPAARSLCAAASPIQARRAMDAAAPADAQPAPTVAWKSREDREIPTSVHSPFLVLVNLKGLRPDEAQSRFMQS